MSPAPISRRARPAKAPLSRDVIVQAGLQILDRDGLDALTMRRVAQELDTGPASLYVYVANRDDLMAAMLDSALGQVTVPDKGTWRQRLHALASATIDAMSQHEGLALVALGGIPTSRNALRILDRMLALLKEGSLDDTTAAWAIDLIYLHITAAAAEQSAYNAKQTNEAEYIADVDRHYTALPADEYPMISGMRQALLSGGDRDTWGLRVLINGILHTPAVAERRPPADDV
jgi:AcrR family transcriptional regulator